MNANILDGSATARTIREEIRQEVDRMRSSGKTVPGLAVIIVGDDPASRVYVNQKKKACVEAGFHSEEFSLPGNISQEILLDQIRKLNGDPKIHGILVQMPLPKGLDPDSAINEIAPDKDVDGLHPYSLGQLLTGGKGFLCCTPQGVIEILKRNGIQMAGMRALVVGRSNMVGKPMAFLLLRENATVTVAHSKTPDLPSEIGKAQILVAAIGRPEFIKGDWITPGTIVVDVGMNSIPDSSKPSGRRLVGDVEFGAASQRASWITPVPGGIGPMTIAMLLSNTLKACKEKGF